MFFHCRDNLCTFVRISVGDRKEMIFSRSSGVSKTALRAASVVMPRVWRRGVAAASSRVVLRFCSLGQLYPRSRDRHSVLTLTGRSSSMSVELALVERVIVSGFCEWVIIHQRKIWYSWDRKVNFELCSNLRMEVVCAAFVLCCRVRDR